MAEHAAAVRLAALDRQDRFLAADIAGDQLELGAEHLVEHDRPGVGFRARSGAGDDHLLLLHVVDGLERRRAPRDAEADILGDGADPGELAHVVAGIARADQRLEDRAAGERRHRRCRRAAPARQDNWPPGCRPRPASPARSRSACPGCDGRGGGRPGGHKDRCRRRRCRPRRWSPDDRSSPARRRLASNPAAARRSTKATNATSCSGLARQPAGIGTSPTSLGTL